MLGPIIVPLPVLKVTVLVPDIESALEGIVEDNVDVVFLSIVCAAGAPVPPFALYVSVIVGLITVQDALGLQVLIALPLICAPKSKVP